MLVGDGDLFPRLMSIEDFPHLLHSIALLPIDGKNVVSRLNVSQADRAPGRDLHDEDSLLVIPAVTVAGSNVLVCCIHTKIGARHFAMVYELRDDALCLIDRDGKAHAFDPFFCDLRTIDPDDLSISGDECPAGVARIDGCIGLDELETLIDIIEAPVQCADDADRHSSLKFKAQWIPNRDRRFSDLQAIRVSQRSYGEIVTAFDLDDSKIGRRIRPHHFAGNCLSGRKRDIDLLAAGDDVVIRHDVAFLVKDHTRSYALPDFDAAVKHIAIIYLGRDADDRRPDLFHRLHDRCIADGRQLLQLLIRPLRYLVRGRSTVLLRDRRKLAEEATSRAADDEQSKCCGEELHPSLAGSGDLFLHGFPMLFQLLIQVFSIHDEYLYSFL